MADERKYYVLCGDNCKFESMTKEQIIAAIAEATGNTPTNIDDAFITKIKESNANNALKFWVGTQAEYNALESVEPNVFYIFTDGDEMQTVERIAEETAHKVATEISNETLVHMQGTCALLWSGYEDAIHSEINIEIPTINEYQLIMVDDKLFRRDGIKFICENIDISAGNTYDITAKKYTFTIKGDNNEMLYINTDDDIEYVRFNYEFGRDPEWLVSGGDGTYGIAITKIYGILKKEG